MWFHLFFQAKERHPEASTLRDVPAETLEALISVGSVRGQGKGSAAAAAAANESWWLAGTAGGSVGQAGGGGGGGGGLSGLSSPTGMGGGGGQGLRAGGALARRKLTPEVLAHARHLAAEVQRVRMGWVLGERGGSEGFTSAYLARVL